MTASRSDLLRQPRHPWSDHSILSGIRIRLPQQAKSVYKLCLIYKIDSNQGRWEAASA
jgi:hypothetical protein